MVASVKFTNNESRIPNYEPAKVTTKKTHPDCSKCVFIKIHTMLFTMTIWRVIFSSSHLLRLLHRQQQHYGVNVVHR